MADNQTNGLDFERVWASVEKTAHLLIRRFKIYGFEYEDLLQEGRIECWKSIKDFDESHNVKFNTYFFARFKNRLRKLYQDANRKKDYYNQHRNSKLTDDMISRVIKSDMKDPLYEAVNQEQLELLIENIKLLPKSVQRILELKSQGWEVSQISRKVVLSKVSIHKLLKTVQELLKTGDPEKIKDYAKKYKKGKKSYIKYLNTVYKKRP